MMKRAFSLVELSIVLVIVGLIVGGILIGQSLIRAGELRSITIDYNRYSTALNTFQEKYSALPGDMKNATKYWGYSGTTVSPGCVNSTGAATTSPGTCDGNGDGYITYGSAMNATGEGFQAWKQLALAGLIEGSYTGNDSNGFNNGAGYGGFSLGVNAPRSKINNVGWELSLYDANVNPPWPVFTYDYRNWFVIGQPDCCFLDYPFLKPEEAWNVDTKMDDGLPAQGSVHGSDPSMTNCTTAVGPNYAADYSAAYRLSNSSTNQCFLLFKP